MDYLPLVIPLIGVISGHILGDEIEISNNTATLLRYFSIGLILTSTAFNFIPDLKYVNKRNDKPLLISVVLIAVVLMVFLKDQTRDNIAQYFVYNLFDIFATGFIIGSATMFHSRKLINLITSLTISTFFAGLINVHDLIKNRYSKKEKIKIILIHFATYFTGIVVAHLVKHQHYIRLLIAGVSVTIIYWLMIKKIFMLKNEDEDEYSYSLVLIYIGALTILLIR